LLAEVSLKSAPEDHVNVVKQACLQIFHRGSLQELVSCLLSISLLQPESQATLLKSIWLQELLEWTVDAEMDGQALVRTSVLMDPCFIHKSARHDTLSGKGPPPRYVSLLRASYPQCVGRFPSRLSSALPSSQLRACCQPKGISTARIPKFCDAIRLAAVVEYPPFGPMTRVGEKAASQLHNTSQQDASEQQSLGLHPILGILCRGRKEASIGTRSLALNEPGRGPILWCSRRNVCPPLGEASETLRGL